jgi:hypothetical protein
MPDRGEIVTERICPKCGRRYHYRSQTVSGVNFLIVDTLDGVDGFAGCVQRRKARDTGSLIGIYHAERAGLDPAGGPWATMCEDHGTVINHETLRLAREHSSDPIGWCEDCRETVARRAVEWSIKRFGVLPWLSAEQWRTVKKWFPVCRRRDVRSEFDEVYTKLRAAS